MEVLLHKSKFCFVLLSWYSRPALTVIQDCWRQVAYHCISAISILHLMHDPFPLQNLLHTKVELHLNNICDGADTSLCVFVHDNRGVLLLKLGICTVRTEGHLISGITPLQLEVVTLCAHCHGPKGRKATMAIRLTVCT